MFQTPKRRVLLNENTSLWQHNRRIFNKYILLLRAKRV
jgi:hypothetical protein